MHVRMCVYMLICKCIYVLKCVCLLLAVAAFKDYAHMRGLALKFV